MKFHQNVIFIIKDGEFDLNNYTIEQLLAELKTANTLLKAIDGNEKRTFAYTCSDTFMNVMDYIKNNRNP